MQPTLRVIADAHAIAVHKGVLIQIWRTATTVEGVRSVRDVVREMGASLGATIVIVEEGAAMPAAPARDELNLLGTELAPRVKLAAVVYEGSGFRAAAVRAVMTGIGLVTRQTLPYKIFASVDGAVVWLMAAHRDVPGVDDLEEVIARTRDKLAATESIFFSRVT